MILLQLNILNIYFEWDSFSPYELYSIRGSNCWTEDKCTCVWSPSIRNLKRLHIKLQNAVRCPIVITVYPKKYAHGFCFAVLCCSYTLTDFSISIRLTSLALWQANDCPSASKATLVNMDKYFMWIHYERLHNHNKAKHNKTMCIFVGIYCICRLSRTQCNIILLTPCN